MLSQSDCQTEGMMCSVTAQTRGTQAPPRVDLPLYRKTWLGEGCTENTDTSSALQLIASSVRIWFPLVPVFTCCLRQNTEMCSLEESSMLWTQENKVVWERHTRRQCLLLGHLWLCPNKGLQDVHSIFKLLSHSAVDAVHLVQLI